MTNSELKFPESAEYQPEDKKLHELSAVGLHQTEQAALEEKYSR